MGSDLRRDHCADLKRLSLILPRQCDDEASPPLTGEASYIQMALASKLACKPRNGAVLFFDPAIDFLACPGQSFGCRADRTWLGQSLFGEHQIEIGLRDDGLATQALEARKSELRGDPSIRGRRGASRGVDRVSRRAGSCDKRTVSLSRPFERLGNALAGLLGQRSGRRLQRRFDRHGAARRALDIAYRQRGIFSAQACAGAQCEAVDQTQRAKECAGHVASISTATGNGERLMSTISLHAQVDTKKAFD